MTLRLLSLKSLAALGVAAALPAQAALRHVPQDCFVVARISGPALWREHFQKTQFLKLLTGPTLGPLLGQLDSMIEQGMDAAPPDLPFDPHKLREKIEAYRGEAVFALRMDVDALPQAIEDDAPPPLTVAIILGGDGTTDLQAMTETLVKKAEEEHQDLRDLTVGDHRLRIGSLPGDNHMEIALPIMIGDQMLMLVGNDLAKQASSFLAPDKPIEADSLASGDLAMHVELGRLMKAILAMASEQAESGGAPFDVGAMFDKMGLTKLDALDFVVRGDGAHVGLDMRLGLADGPRGLLGMLGDKSAKEPKLLDYTPTDAASWSASHLELRALYTTFAEIWESLGDVVPMQFDAFEQGFAEELKVRLKEDLIDHLGTEMLMVEMQAAADPEEDLDGDPQMAMFMAMFSGSCFGISLRDGKAFGESIERLIRSRGLHASRKTEDYQGEKIHRMRLVGLVDLEYCIADDVALLTLDKGEGGKQSLRAILDERAARRGGKPRREIPEQIRSRLERLPAGWSSISATSILPIFDALSFGLRAGIEEAGADVPIDMIEGVFSRLAPELKRLGLDRPVSTSYLEANAFVSRARW